MRVLITGGAGFIGSHLSNSLLDIGYRVFVIDNLSKGKKENLHSKAIFFKEDIRSENFSNILKKIKPDIIYHFAAQSSLSKSLKNPKEDLEINLLATQNLIEMANKLKVKKVVFASSAAVYGEVKKLPIAEDSPKNPISIYGVSKLASEYLFIINHKINNLPFVSLRYANVYGENQDSKAEGGVVAIFINNILKDKDVIINSNGRQTRDFIYVSDVVDACVKVLKDNLVGEFNVATATETTINDLYGKILKIAATKEKKEYRGFGYLEVKRSSLSYFKLNKLAGWRPRVDLEQGLLKTFNYFKNLQ